MCECFEHVDACFDLERLCFCPVDSCVCHSLTLFSGENYLFAIYVFACEFVMGISSTIGYLYVGFARAANSFDLLDFFSLYYCEYIFLKFVSMYVTEVMVEKFGVFWVLTVKCNEGIVCCHYGNEPHVLYLEHFVSDCSATVFGS